MVSHATLEARAEVTVALSLGISRVLGILVSGARGLLEVWAGCLWVVGAWSLMIMAWHMEVRALHLELRAVVVHGWTVGMVVLVLGAEE